LLQLPEKEEWDHTLSSRWTLCWWAQREVLDKVRMHSARPLQPKATMWRLKHLLRHMHKTMVTLMTPLCQPALDLVGPPLPKT
jgi:hypothetical protein